MNAIRQWMNDFLRAGLTRKELDMCLPEIRKRNVDTLGRIIPVFWGIMLALFAVSFVPGSGEQGNRFTYLAYMIILLGLMVAHSRYFADHPKHIAKLSCLFMAVVFSFGIRLACFVGPDTSSAPFCVLLVAVPLLLIEVPSRLTLMTAAAEIVLLICCAAVGNTQGDRFVVINTLSSTLISIGCSASIQRTKFSDIRYHLMLEVQRDTDMMTGARSRVAYVRDLGIINDEGTPAGVIFADVNGLKAANDTYGHEAGDRLIKDAFSLMLRYYHQDTDSIYRIGGDEFVVLSLGEDRRSFEARCKAMTTLDDDRELISCGSVWLDRVKDAESAIREAEQLMYVEKGRFYKDHPDQDRSIQKQAVSR